MPIFTFNKLVRDKMPLLYGELKQKIISRQLTRNDLRVALKEKLIEEAQEIPIPDGTREEIIAELGDLEQLIDDLKNEYSISDEEIMKVKERKLAQKGGFSDGIFVESIELADDDEWVEYYRKEPKKYPEMKKNGKIDRELPELKKGTYRHNKSKQLYEVIGVTFNTETYEPLVIYRPMYNHEEYELFARPYDMFVEKIELNGTMKQRFEKIDA